MKFALICLVLISAASTQFTSDGQKAILKIHNDLRSRVALDKESVPSAADMLRLEYDPALEASAQEYADTCPQGDENNSTVVGQNVYFGTYSSPSKNLDSHGVSAALKWRTQLEKGFDSLLFSDNDVYRGVGEVAQMIWAKSGSIGCAVKDCGPSSIYTTNLVTVVCHYKSKGKQVGEYIYTEGETGSKCPAGTSHEASSGLCVPN